MSTENAVLGEIPASNIVDDAVAADERLIENWQIEVTGEGLIDATNTATGKKFSGSTLDFNRTYFQ